MRFKVLISILVGYVLGTAGCGGSAKDSPAPPTTQSATASARSDLRTLIDSLGRVQATVIVTPSQAWHVEGVDGLLGSFPQFGDSAVRPLVACLADTSSAQATYNDIPVRKGLMCYAALQMVAYSEGGESESWAGAVLPTTTPQGLIEAAKAWQEVVSRGGYKLN
jgi:hypothetical protein